MPLAVGKTKLSFRVLKSLEAGKRLPEARFAQLTVAAKGQGSVYGLYSTTTSTPKLTPDP